MRTDVLGKYLFNLRRHLKVFCLIAEKQSMKHLIWLLALALSGCMMNPIIVGFDRANIDQVSIKAANEKKATPTAVEYCKGAVDLMRIEGHIYTFHCARSGERSTSSAQ